MDSEWDALKYIKEVYFVHKYIVFLIKIEHEVGANTVGSFIYYKSIIANTTIPTLTPDILKKFRNVLKFSDFIYKTSKETSEMWNIVEKYFWWRTSN